MGIKLNRVEWEDFSSRLNNPTKENMETRNKFFEECDKLTIVSKDNGAIIVECPDLDEDKILRGINYEDV